MSVEKSHPTPLIAGAVYATTGSDGRPTEGMIRSVRLAPNGSREGEFMIFGHKPEKVIEGSDRMNSLRLVGRPASPKIGRPRKAAK
jgi:hypothetical protein